VSLNTNEVVKAEAGAMVAMSDTIGVEGKLEGGILGGLVGNYSFNTVYRTKGWFFCGLGFLRAIY